MAILYNIHEMKRLRYSLILSLCVFVLTLLSLVSCARESVEIKNTVTAYTRLLAEALAKPDFNVLSLFASNAELKRISSYITYNLKEHRIIINDMESLEFGKVELGDDGRTSRVWTNERWSFHYIDDRTRQRVTEDSRVRYSNIYHLKKTQGRWVVDRVEARELSPGEAGGG